MQGKNNPNPMMDDGFSDFFDEQPIEQQEQEVIEEDTPIQEEPRGAYQYESIEEPTDEQYGWGQDTSGYGEGTQNDWGSEYNESPVETEPVLDKKAAKAKAKQDKLAAKKAKSAAKTNNQVVVEQPEVEEQQDKILYIVIDKAIPGLINYFRECGVKVSNIFNDIVDAKNTVLMQSEPIRIVVIDTGMGKFTTTAMRAELIDMLGIADENSRTTVFFTDSALKVDTIRTLGKSSKKIDWIQYKSTAVVAGTILSYGENYIYDMEDDLDVVEKDRGALHFKGLTSSEIKTTPQHNIVGLSGPAILRNMIEDQGEGLPSFEMKFLS